MLNSLRLLIASICFAGAFKPVLLFAVSSPEIEVPRLENGTKIDGILDEEQWDMAASISDFTQVEPVSMGEPSQRTELRVFSTSKALYLGILCFDSEPDKILAKERRRDNPGRGDDRIRFVFDTFGRGIDGYYFGVAGGGGKADGVVRSGGRPDLTWDTIWDCDTSKDSKGWYAEIEIPFRSLAFDKSKTVWNFNVEREIRRDHEKVRWASPTRLRSMWTLQGLGKLKGLENLDTGIGLDFKPTLLGRYRSTDESGSDFDFEPSFDAFYRITPSLTATMTWQTDFAETDVDDRQVNTTRFPLFFPEKRAFFLEDAEKFRFGGIMRSPLPFHSRTIGLDSKGNRVPIQLGAKITGKEDKWNIGLLGVRLEETDSLAKDDVYVGRVSYDLFEESSVGAIFTLGDPRSNEEAETVGVDFELKDSSFREQKTGIIRGWAMRTDTEKGDGDGWGLTAIYPNKPLYARLTVQRVGEDLDPAAGFLRRPGIYEWWSFLGYEIYPDTDLINEIDFDLKTHIDTDFDSNALTEEIELETDFEMASGDFIEVGIKRERELFEEDFEIYDNIIVPEGDYSYWRARAGIMTAQSRGIYFTAGTDLGARDFLDGTKYGLNGSIGWQPSPTFSMDLGTEMDWYDLEGGEFEALIVNGSIRYTPTKKLSFSTRVQFDTVSDELGLNSRIRWMVNPSSDVYLVFNQGYRRFDDRFDRTLTEGVVKAGWTFRF